MTDSNLADRTRITSELNTLQQSISEQALLQDVTQLSNEIESLPGKVQSIRQRNYQYASDLDQQIADIRKQWQIVQDEMRYRAQVSSQRYVWDLTDLRAIESRLNNGDASSWQSYIPRFQSEITRIQTAIQNTHKAILQAAGNIPDQLKVITTRLAHLETTAKHISEAGFSFNSGEMVYLAANAEWKKGKNDKENPDGVLYVTNQRLIMEQNEKKGGMMGFGGSKVQQFLWGIPWASVQGVFSENKGLFGNIDLVHVKLSDGIPAPEAIILIKGDYKSDWFAAQILSVQRGDIERERINKS